MFFEKDEIMSAKRIIAVIIDLVIVGLIQFVLMVLFLIKPMMDHSLIAEGFNVMIRQLVITYGSMGFFIIRDIIGKKSLGKIIMKLKIINKSDGQETTLLKRLLRNLTWILGPIDIIFYLITKERMGDQLVKTNVVEI